MINRTEINSPGTFFTGGDILTGKPGDWVMQYAPGDYGVTENARFQSVYRLHRDTLPS